MPFRLLLALAVLFLGLWLVLGTTHDRFAPPRVGRSALLIRTVHRGSIPIPSEGAKSAGSDISSSSAGPMYGRIENVNYVERGSFDQRNAEARVFRVDPDGKTATQVPVRFGIIAAELIEIKEGLHEGDQVIVSDMSRWSNVDRVWFE